MWKYMKLDLTKVQYKELIRLVMLGTEVKMTALEAMGQPHEDADALETYLLEHVEDFELDELVRKVGDETLPSEKLVHEIDHLMHHYDDDSFWFALETELGQRDFYESLSFNERRALKESDGQLPEEVTEFYEKYATEFERHGTDRLRLVIEKAKNYNS